MPEEQTWDVDACTSCVCQAGQVVCARKICAVACDNPVPVPGECCPVCQDEASKRRSYPFLNGTSKVTHRTRVSVPDHATQTTRPGVQRENGGSQPSTLQIVLYLVLAGVLLLVLLLAVWCVCWHRRRSGYKPKQEPTDEKRPLNGAQTIDFAHMNGANGVAVLQAKSHARDRPNISLVRDA